MMRALTLFTLAAAASLASPGASAAEDRKADLVVVRHYSPEEMARLGMRGRLPGSPNVVDPLAIFSNITTFSGQGFAQGPSAPVGVGAFITRLVMDDLTFTTNPLVSNVTTVRFSVFNGNAVNVSARARLRFWSSDGAPLGAGLPNGPGTPFPSGFSFNPISFAAGGTTVSGNLGAGFAVPAGTTSTVWAGITFDSDNGAGGNTGATQAQMDMMGQLMFGPVDLGSSTNTLFETTNAGSFLGVANPLGAAVNFGGAPLANDAWEWVVTTLPVELQGFKVQ